MANNNQQDEIYMNNSNLPTSRAKFEYTPEMLKEIAVCTGDIAHFAENYFYITTLDEGKKKIKLYPPQKRIVKALGKYNRVVTLASRQTGKCCSYETLIKVRNKKTLEIEELTIGEFHERMKNQNW